MTKKKNKGLNFEYCECGCHGHSASMANIHYWLYNDLKHKENSFKLHQGHGWISPLIKTFASFEAAVDFANEMAQKEFNKIKSELGFK